MSYLVAAPEFLVSAEADLVPVGSSERGECGRGCPDHGGAGVPLALGRGPATGSWGGFGGNGGDAGCFGDGGDGGTAFVVGPGGPGGSGGQLLGALGAPENPG
jgi:hypothetical protein